MGLKGLVRRLTSNPAKYAHYFSIRLLEASEDLASHFVAFSGLHDSDGSAHRFLFPDAFELAMAGFAPATTDFVDLVQPNVAELSKQPLFERAYVGAIAFLSLVADNAARDKMKVDNAEQFCQGLALSVASKAAGHYGLDDDAYRTLERIQLLIPTFLCKRLLNPDDFGNDDGLGKILDYLSLSADHKIAYGFIVGSNKQPMGCAVRYGICVARVREEIDLCVRETGW